MKGKLVRYQKAGAFHFITFSCYRRQPLLDAALSYDCFERELETVRRQYDFVVPGYVLMPEHVHLAGGLGLSELNSPPRVGALGLAFETWGQVLIDLKNFCGF